MEQNAIDVYNAFALKRMMKNSHTEPHPPIDGLVKDCRIWDLAVTPDGYGNFWYNNRTIGVHRASYLIANNLIVFPDDEKRHVAHICNVRACCEPSHLYLASPVQNGQDQADNGLKRGGKNHNTTLNDNIIREIRLSKGKGTRAERAEQFGVSKRTIKHVDYGDAWTYVPDVNGNILEDKRLKRNETVRKRQKKLKEEEWSKEFLLEAEKKLTNQEYVKQDCNVFNGSNCIVWIRYHTPRGYPKMGLAGIRDIRVHILACAIGNNYTREKNKIAFHECGNKSCVNPLHLKFKTFQEAVDYRLSRDVLTDSPDSVDSEELFDSVESEYLLNSEE